MEDTAKPKFFGQYLIEKGRITNQQLREALEYQHNAVKRIGDIAVIKGFMTLEQVKKVNLEQRRTDKYFGELAISMGFLTPEQLDMIVNIQKHNHIYLGQALIEKKFITEAELRKYLELYHEEQKPISTLDKIIPADFERREEVIHLLDVSVKIFRRMANMLLKLGKGYYQEKKIDNLFLISRVTFSGSLDLQYFMNVPAHVAVTITKNLYGKVDVECDDATICDCIGELSNVICGNASSHLLEMGHKLRITPPESLLRTETPTWRIEESGELLIFPATVPLPAGYIDVGLLFKNPEETPKSVVKSDTKADNYSVLIVDDSSLCRQQLTDIIMTLPNITEIKAASNGEEALKILNEFNPDIAIVDLVMPGIPGEEVVQQIHEQNEKTKIIVLSSLGGSADKILEELRAGAVIVAVKPIDEYSVKNAIKNAIG